MGPKPLNLLGKASVWFLAVCFFLSSLQPPVFCADSVPLVFLDPSKINASFSIPKEYGSIQEIFIPARPAQNKAVIYIQDAHANYEAAKNVRDLIRWIQEQYGNLPAVLLEGGDGALDPVFIQSFPDASIKAKVLEQYLKEGSLSGPEAALFLENRTGRYFGIERQSVYDENRRAFLEAIENQKELAKPLAILNGALERKLERLSSSPLTAFIRAKKSYEQESLDFLAYLLTLASFVPALEAYPEISKILRYQETENSIRTGQVKAALRDWSLLLRNEISPRVSPEKAKGLGGLLQAFETGAMAPQDFIREVHRLFNDQTDLRLPAALKPLKDQSLLLLTVDHSALFREVERLEHEAGNSLAQSEQDKKFLRAVEQVSLLQKFSKLELRHPEWETLQNGNPLLSDESISSLELLEPETVQIKNLSAGLRPHFLFYEKAVLRDQILYEHMNERMAQSGAKVSLLMTGGFHSEGMTQKLRKDGIPYILIRPEMSSIPAESRYASLMQGGASYMRYYDGNLYDAFARDFAEKAMLEIKESRAIVLKEWRDEVIRRLAEEGRLDEAGRLHHMIDRLRGKLDSSGPALTLQERLMDEYQKFISNHFEGVRKRLLSAFEPWKKGLEAIWESGPAQDDGLSAIFKNSGVSKVPALSLPLLSIPGTRVETEFGRSESRSELGLDSRVLRHARELLKNDRVMFAEVYGARVIRETLEDFPGLREADLFGQDFSPTAYDGHVLAGEKVSSRRTRLLESFKKEKIHIPGKGRASLLEGSFDFEGKISFDGFVELKNGTRRPIRFNLYQRTPEQLDWPIGQDPWFRQRYALAVVDRPGRWAEWNSLENRGRGMDFFERTMWGTVRGGLLFIRESALPPKRLLDNTEIIAENVDTHRAYRLAQNQFVLYQLHEPLLRYPFNDPEAVLPLESPTLFPKRSFPVEKLKTHSMILAAEEGFDPEDLTPGYRYYRIYLSNPSDPHSALYLDHSDDLTQWKGRQVLLRADHELVARNPKGTVLFKLIRDEKDLVVERLAPDRGDPFIFTFLSLPEEEKTLEEERPRRTSSRSEAREVPSIESAEFFAAGAAAEYAAQATQKKPLEKKTLDPKIFEEVMTDIRKLTKSRRGQYREQAESVTAHLEKLFKEGKIQVFEELRWLTEESYYFGETGNDSLLLAEGFFSRDTETARKFSAEILFIAAARSLGLPKDKLEPLLEKMFGEFKVFQNQYRAFRDLTDDFHLNSAVQRFHDFELGGRYSDIFPFLTEWTAYDEKRFLKKGPRWDLPVLEQAGFLARQIRMDLSRMKEEYTRLNQALKDKGKRTEPYRSDYYDWLNRITVPYLEFYLSLAVLMKHVSITRANLSRADAEVESKFMKPFAEIDKAAIREYVHSTIEGIIQFDQALKRPDFEVPPDWSHAFIAPLQEEISAPVLLAAQKAWTDLLKNTLRKSLKWQDQRMEDAERVEEREVTPMPAFGELSTKDLGQITESVFRHQFVRDYHHVGNYARLTSQDGPFTWNSHIGMEEDEESVNVLTIDKIQRSSLVPLPFVHGYIFDGSRNQLIITRFEQALWMDLVMWFQDEPRRYGSAPWHIATENAALQTIMPVLVGIRQALTAEKIVKENVFAPGGIDLRPWVHRILNLQTVGDTALWETVHDYYKDDYRKGLAAMNEDDDLGNKLWYYSLFTHPEGLFKYLADKLETLPQSDRLTPEAAKHLLDTLYAIYWGGKHRDDDHAEGFMFILYQILSRIQLYPDGIAVKDLSEFKQFLTGWMSETLDASPQTFEQWEHRFKAKFPDYAGGSYNSLAKFLPRANREIELTDLPATDQVMLRLQDLNLFTPVFFPAASLFNPEQYPWKQIRSTKIAIWQGVYEEAGLAVPGLPFRLRLSGIQPGDRLVVHVTGKIVSVAQITGKDKNDVEPILMLPLDEFKRNDSARYNTLNGQTCQKVPDMNFVKPLSGEMKNLPDGAYRVPASDDGFFIFPYWERELMFAAKDVSDHLVVSVVGSRLSFFRDLGASLEPIGEAVVDISRLVKVSGGSVRILPELSPAVQHLRPASLFHYMMLNQLAGLVQPHISRGLRYRVEIDESSAAEQPNIRIEGNRLILSPHFLKLGAEIGPADAGRRIEEVIRNSDPILLLQGQVQFFQNLLNTENLDEIYRADLAIPDELEAVPAETRRSWVSDANTEYERLSQQMKALRRELNILRSLNRYRLEHANDLGKFSKRDLFHQKLKEILQSATYSSGFYFAGARSDWKNQNAMMEAERLHHTSSEGLGLASIGAFDSDTRNKIFQLSDKFSIGKNKEPYLFVRHKANGEQKPVCVLFDFDTGEQLSGDDQAYRELAARRENILSGILGDAERQHAHLDYRLSINQSLLDFLDRFQGNNDVEILSIQTAVLERLRLLLNVILNTRDYPMALNQAVLSMIFEEILVSGIQKAEERIQTFESSLHGKQPEDILFYLSAYLDEADHSALGLTVKNNEVVFDEQFEEFVRMILIPSLTQDWPDKPALSHEGYFERLFNHMTYVRAQMERMMTEFPGAIAGDSLSGYSWNPDFYHKLISDQIAVKENGNSKLLPPNSFQTYFLDLYFRRQAEALVEEVEKKGEGVTGLKPLHIAGRSLDVRPLGDIRVGTSSFFFNRKGASFIVDAGARSKLFRPDETPNFSWLDGIAPEERPKSVFITHTHRDHIGSVIPLMKKLDPEARVYVLKGTKKILRLALKNMAETSAADYQRMREKSGLGLDFEHWMLFQESDISSFMDHVTELEPNVWYQTGSEMKVKLMNAGHVPGAASLLISTPDGETLMSGDISVHPQGAVPGFALPEGETVTHAIMEATYGMRATEDQDVLENELADRVLETLTKGGKVLIPVPAQGKSQRILSILLKHLPENLKNRIKIYGDGQAAQFLKLYQENYSELRHPAVSFVPDARNVSRARSEIVQQKDPAVIIASSASVSQGSASGYYASALIENPNNLILLVGHALDTEETGDRLLNMEKGSRHYFGDGKLRQINAGVIRIPLSEHAYGSEILELMKSMNSNGQLQWTTFVHGETNARYALVNQVTKSLRQGNQQYGKGANTMESGVKMMTRISPSEEEQKRQQERYLSHEAAELPRSEARSMKGAPEQRMRYAQQFWASPHLLSETKLDSQTGQESMNGPGPKIVDLRDFLEVLRRSEILSETEIKALDYFHDRTRLMADAKTQLRLWNQFQTETGLDYGKARRIYNQAMQTLAAAADGISWGTPPEKVLLSYQGKEHLLKLAADRKLGTPTARKAFGIVNGKHHPELIARSRKGREKIRHKTTPFRSELRTAEVQTLLSVAPAVKEFSELGRVISGQKLLQWMDQEGWNREEMIRRLAWKMQEVDRIAFGLGEKETPGIVNDHISLIQKSGLRIPAGGFFLFAGQDGSLQGFLEFNYSDKTVELETFSTAKKKDRVSGRGNILLDAFFDALSAQGIREVHWQSARDQVSHYEWYLADRNLSFSRSTRFRGEPFFSVSVPSAEGGIPESIPDWIRALNGNRLYPDSFSKVSQAVRQAQASGLSFADFGQIMVQAFGDWVQRQERLWETRAVKITDVLLANPDSPETAIGEMLRNAGMTEEAGFGAGEVEALAKTLKAVEGRRAPQDFSVQAHRAFEHLQTLRQESVIYFDLPGSLTQSSGRSEQIEKLIRTAKDIVRFNPRLKVVFLTDSAREEAEMEKNLQRLILKTDPEKIRNREQIRVVRGPDLGTFNEKEIAIRVSESSIGQPKNQTPVQLDALRFADQNLIDYQDPANPDTCSLVLLAAAAQIAAEALTEKTAEGLARGDDQVLRILNRSSLNQWSLLSRLIADALTQQVTGRSA